ncbi:MAG: serine/threonine-protein kinase [Myxococcota bacterium]
MPAEPGTIIAKRYRLLRQLGKGGMGEVFAAENTRTGRQVALKLLRAESKTKQSAIERFRREARAAGSISSDFVTQVIDVEDDPDHGIVLVFELLEGESLVERLKRTGPIPYLELWGIVEAVWMGLADAHASGIVHRDLKPSNVFLERRRNGTRVKILDFGISKLPKKFSTDSLTQWGQSLGTFSFMPPEQIGKAKSVDHRADIYACATLIYQAMSGKLPYHAKNVVGMMEAKTKSEPRTLASVMRDPIDPRLEAFIARGLARNPDQRFQTALDALDAWRQLRPQGAASMLDVDPSGVYPPPSFGDDVEDEESASEVKTRVLGQKDLFGDGGLEAALRQRENLRATKAVGRRATAPLGATPAPNGSPALTPSGGAPAAQPANRSVASAFHPSASTQPINAPSVANESTLVDEGIAVLAARDAANASDPSFGSSMPTPENGRPARPRRPAPASSSGPRAATLIIGMLGLVLLGFVTMVLLLRFIH